MVVSKSRSPSLSISPSNWSREFVRATSVVSRKKPRPAPAVAAVNWYTCRIALVAAAFVSVFGTVTLTRSPGAKAWAGAKLRLAVPPPLTVPGRRPRTWLPYTRRLAAELAVIACVKFTVTGPERGAATACRAGNNVVTAGACASASKLLITVTKLKQISERTEGVDSCCINRDKVTVNKL